MKEQIESYVFDGHFVGPPLFTVFTFSDFLVYVYVPLLWQFVPPSRASEK
jgi:hypothetical protein